MTEKRTNETKTKKLWMLLTGVLITTFSILGYFGTEVYRKAPPIPEKIVTSGGELIMTKDDILDGQQVWQSMGGQHVGSIWGHGAYQAPDWTADWLHRELSWMLNYWAQEKHQSSFEELDSENQGALLARLKTTYKTNTYDKNTGTVVISEDRYRAFKATSIHYIDLFGDTPSMQKLREDYAIQENAIPDKESRLKMATFYYWTVWAAVTERPGKNVTYTNNWPHEPLLDMKPSSESVLWTIISVTLLLMGIGGLVWYLAFKKRDNEEIHQVPKEDPFDKIPVTPSMKSLWKYCAVVILLFVLQVILGGVLAHYTVEGQSFYGLPLSKILPYSLARTWHIQIALFWIATSFLTTGLFLAPIINGGKDPKYQRIGVNVLFGALLTIVFGSLLGEYLAIHHIIGIKLNFWFGHQGYEYIELGRVWQIALLIGFVLWLVLMLRCIIPAIKRTKEHRSLLVMFAGATAAIALFYGAGLFYGSRTHLSVMEYWRWWVVHLWVEGFFEVFATVSLAIIFSRLGLIKTQHATQASLASTCLFLLGGIPGTFHHLYFSGTPTSVTAIGACFSALEVVPLMLIGYEAWETSRRTHQASWMKKYTWPITFFVGVAFWNLVGAGILGFMINPPVALYYMQGLNTTAAHAHAATFGVYGLLSLGLILIVMRKLTAQHYQWKEHWLKVSFWAMNIGLALMLVLSLLPVGLLQTWANIEHGLWYARSEAFLQSGIIPTLRWMRIIGDSIFIFGVGALAYFVAGVAFGWSLKRQEESQLNEKNQDILSELETV